MLLALGDFLRNLSESIELRGFLGFGGWGRVGAENGPQPGSESSGPSDCPRSRGLESSRSGVAAGSWRTSVMDGQSVLVEFDEGGVMQRGDDPVEMDFKQRDKLLRTQLIEGEL